MRIIHFADLHIGVELYGRPIPDRPWSSRMQDFLDAFDFLVDYAIEEGADAVIFAGDAYKSREPTQTQQREFARRLRRLSEAEIETFLLVGNHDLPNADGRAHVLEIFRTLRVPHVHIGDQSWFRESGLRPRVLDTKAGPLQTAFLPWPQVSQLMANEPKAATMSIDQVHQRVEQLLGEGIEAQRKELDPDIPSLLACHVSINDFIVKDNEGSEKWMTVGTVPTLLKSNLQEDAFDYIALGHHHNQMDLGLNTPCFYSGSMQPVDFGEEDQTKGFMVFDIDPSGGHGDRIAGSGAPRLVEVPTRRFISISCKPNDDDPTPEVCRAVDRKDVNDAIVRVEVHVSKDQAAQLRMPEVRRALDRSHYVAHLRTVLPDDVRSAATAGIQPDSAAPLESLEIYLKAKDTEEERRERLLAVAADVVTTVDDEAVSADG